MRQNLPKIKVVGVGGSGVNAINRMKEGGIFGVDLIAVNTDAQSLKLCPVNHRILLGKNTTHGWGAGMDVKLGAKAARESIDELKQALVGAEMIFLTCGLGGGSGTSGIPILGEIAKSLGILTMAVVTLPFSFEGQQRKNVAQQGLRDLEDKVDALLVIPNDKLLGLAKPNTTVSAAFWVCDEVLRESVKAISDLVSLPGIINVDFADLKSILKNAGRAFLGIGRAHGEKRAIIAASAALRSSLLDFSLKDASGILINIAGAGDLSLSEVNMAANFIKKNASSKAKIVFGVSEDGSLKDSEMKITVIATSK
ncbi:MAG: cell division protein FtsZ [Candidatus Pacebacteria bacterium]|nr:cell division protein FtsZ [Candidatus Paceibacterota bacterium]